MCGTTVKISGSNTVPLEANRTMPNCTYCKKGLNSLARLIDPRRRGCDNVTPMTSMLVRLILGEDGYDIHQQPPKHATILTNE